MVFTIIETRAHFPRLLQDRRRPPVSTGMKAILVKHEKFNCTSLLGGAENHTDCCSLLLQNRKTSPFLLSSDQIITPLGWTLN